MLSHMLYAARTKLSPTIHPMRERHWLLFGLALILDHIFMVKDSLW